jgi:hypothetical protein
VFPPSERRQSLLRRREKKTTPGGGAKQNLLVRINRTRSRLCYLLFRLDSTREDANPMESHPYVWARNNVNRITSLQKNRGGGMQLKFYFTFVLRRELPSLCALCLCALCVKSARSRPCTLGARHPQVPQNLHLHKMGEGVSF